ncbi:FMN-dependent NADH-azoreductase [Pseudoclavibacter sp. AY1F1]|uniref:FMN-dependent NADH-azoreductase n=1 Tax=Pseudoclavibacter sp. AY1F1 TaxID=2080583 RepID=UPI000CE71FD3|nr:NAD(P)H-dependent oxidoreductase [Pseudoclavibacter sp. AY1F1]PPF45978.1 FMN-dependent NADH-azoreductase [Pseudoclavibacter sp. AY1F1]
MPTLLHIDSSADLTTSRTRALTAVFAETWTSRGADHTVVYRDLHRDQLPHLQSVAQHWPPRLRGGVEVPASAAALQQELLSELLAADVVVIGAPLYNYSMPSTLKAWVDHIHVPGITSPFDEATQPLAGRPAVVISARGASYDAGSPSESWDHGSAALKIVLGESLGMEVTVVATSRTLADVVPALGSEAAAREFEAAREQVRELASTL